MEDITSQIENYQESSYKNGAFQGKNPDIHAFYPVFIASVSSFLHDFVENPSTLQNNPIFSVREFY
jgi:hypothetical protein